MSWHGTLYTPHKRVMLLIVSTQINLTPAVLAVLINYHTAMHYGIDVDLGKMFVVISSLLSYLLTAATWVSNWVSLRRKKRKYIQFTWDEQVIKIHKIDLFTVIIYFYCWSYIIILGYIHTQTHAYQIEWMFNTNEYEKLMDLLFVKLVQLQVKTNEITSWNSLYIHTKMLFLNGNWLIMSVFWIRVQVLPRNFNGKFYVFINLQFFFLCFDVKTWLSCVHHT